MNNHIQALEEKRFLKIIAGINNFDAENVLRIAKSAEQAGANAVDICAKPEIIEEVIVKCPNIMVCVSSVSVAELLAAEALGADMLELGNYEALHDAGIFPSAEEVLEWAAELVKTKSRSLISVTIPGHLSVAEQVALAAELDVMGVDIIQTEGAALVSSSAPGALGALEKARLTLANTIEISKAVEKAYVMTASAINPDTAPIAIASGASGIGVGKYVSKLGSEIEMLAAVMALKESLSKSRSKVSS